MLKKIGFFFLNLVEIYLPVVTFVIMFCAFILQIFYRYALNNPLTWPHEVTVIVFIWTVLLGAGFARRQHEHVAFTIFYDNRSPRTQTVFRLLGNLIIFITFCLALYPVFDFIQFMKIQKSSVLGIPFNIIFFSFFLFFLTIIGHTGYDLVCDFKELFSLKSKVVNKGISAEGN